MNMHFTYVLRSLRDNELYVGITNNLRRRFLEHQQGRNISTASRRPFELLFYEAFKHAEDAKRRERYFKTSKGRTMLKQILLHSLE